MKTIILLLMLTISIVGCASGPKFNGLQEIDSEVGVIYFLRTSYIGLFYGTRIKIDGESVGEVDTGGYLKVSVKPGVHKVEVLVGEENNEVATKFDIYVETRARYYFMCNQDISSIMSYGSAIVIEGSGTAQQIEEIDALNILKDLKESL